MGAKIPGRFKTRRPTCKCDICGNNFLNIQALRSHQACVHPRTKRVAYKPKTEVIARRKLVPVKKALKTNVKAKAAPKTVKKATSEVSQSPDDKRYNTRRTEFECPVCAKIFTVYFSAYRHIQKHHCVNEEGEAVPANSSDLIKPTKIELCVTCNKRVVSNQVHSCAPSFSIGEVSHHNCYTCLGCEQTFSSLHLFDVHIPGLHSDVVESLFFPDKETFSAWQDSMEVQAEMKYVLLNKRENFRIEHCSYVRTDDKTAWFCPSSFTVQEFSKGIQVAFYKEHFGHDSKPYKIPEKFDKYVMNKILKNKEVTYTVTKPRANQTDVTQFQNLMNSIIKMAPRVDCDELKTLVSKAMDMSEIVRKYEVMDKVAEMNKKEEENKIEIVQRKRKIDTDVVTPKRPKIDVKEPTPEPPEVTKTPIKSVAKVFKPVPTKEDEKKLIPEQPSPSSFNDSYKNFVDASYKLKDRPPVKNKTEVKKKEVVKTKIGQFKKAVVSPNKLPSPAVKKDFEYEVIEQDNDCNILVIRI